MRAVRVKRAMFAGAMLFAGALALTACAGSGAPSAGSTPPSASPEPRSTVVPPSATPTVPPSSSTGEGSVAERDQDPFTDDELVAARCQDSQLELAVVPLPDESGAGQFGFELVFTNTAALPCTFDGWPGLIAIAADGTELGWPAQADFSTPSSLVVLRGDGGVATSQVRASQAGAYDCEQIEAWGLRARITSDGAGGGIDARYAITVCGGNISTMTTSPLTTG